MTDLIIETPEENWAKAREAAQVWLRKAPEGPLGTIAHAHEDYWMYWLDWHQFHPWGYNVRALVELWDEVIANATTPVVPSMATTESAALASPPLDT